MPLSESTSTTAGSVHRTAGTSPTASPAAAACSHSAGIELSTPPGQRPAEPLTARTDDGACWTAEGRVKGDSGRFSICCSKMCAESAAGVGCANTAVGASLHDGTRSFSWSMSCTTSTESRPSSMKPVCIAARASLAPTPTPAPPPRRPPRGPGSTRSARRAPRSPCPPGGNRPPTRASALPRLGGSVARGRSPSPHALQTTARRLPSTRGSVLRHIRSAPPPAAPGAARRSAAHHPGCPHSEARPRPAAASLLRVACAASPPSAAPPYAAPLRKPRAACTWRQAARRRHRRRRTGRSARTRAAAAASSRTSARTQNPTAPPARAAAASPRASRAETPRTARARGQVGAWQQARLRQRQLPVRRGHQHLARPRLQRVEVERRRLGHELSGVRHRQRVHLEEQQPVPTRHRCPTPHLGSGHGHG
eukprot:scaffold23206_cov82-Phaeocystis_antarctica.AAC.5